MSFISKIKSFLFKQDKIKNTRNSTTKNVCTGVIKFFNHSRGYGFIDSNAFEKKVFLHISDLEDRVTKGQKVRFEVEKTSKGLRAKNVEVASA